MNTLRVVHLGKAPYAAVLRVQEDLFRRRKLGAVPDTLLLVEHDPAVVTVGNRKEGLTDLPHGAAPGGLLPDGATEVVRIQRGGRATWHGPGQLTAYPIVNFKELRAASQFAAEEPGLVYWWVRVLERSVLGLLRRAGVRAWTCGDVGLWVGGPVDPVPRPNDPPHTVVADADRAATDFGPQRKVAAVGVQLQRYCSMHGVAVNICPDLTAFAGFVPCGLDAAVTSVAAEVPGCELTPATAAPVFVDSFVEALQPKVDLNVVEHPAEPYLSFASSA